MQKNFWKITSIPIIGFIIMSTLFPIYWTFLLSIKTNSQIHNNPPLFFFHGTINNYSSSILGIGQSLPIGPYLINSTIVAFASTLLSVTIGSLAAYAFTRFKLRRKELVMFANLVTLMLPPVVIAIPLYVLMTRLHLEGSLLAIILAHGFFNTPFVIWMMRSFFQEVPIDVEEQSLVDGASPFQTFILIALPLASPGLVSTSILAAFYSWNEFIFALILSGVDTQTIPVFIATFQREVEMVPWGELGASVILAILPVLIFTMAVQRYLVRGLTLGAVKG